MQQQGYRERGERRDSTRRCVAHEVNIRDFAALLFVDEEPVRKALLNEPLAEALAMVQWALTHEADEDFDASRALTGWARKRGRGAWRESREPEIEAALEALDGDGRRDTELAAYWSKNRSYIIAELDRMAGTIQCDATRYANCFDCGARRKHRDMWEVGPEQADNSLELGGGELLCDGCSVRHGVR